MSQKIIEMRNIKKSYFIGKPNELEILHGIDLDIYENDFVAIVGESGSGKSTLMNILGALDTPTKGSYILDGIDVLHASSKQLANIRNKKVGFVFQNFNLISRTSALKNVELPMLYAKVNANTRHERAKELLELVGIGTRMKHMPNELSGGQKQRVAIARAISNNPAILLADEPTGALDSENSRVVMDIFHDLHDNYGMTIVLITHSQQLAKEAQKIITLSDGKIVNFESR